MLMNTWQLVRNGLIVAIVSTSSLAQQSIEPQSPRPPSHGRGDTQRYSIEQAISDRAQLHTIAFDALAFLTGDFAHDTFLPPGKVSDYFGFQYMRDIDAKHSGHSTSFLTTIALNILTLLNQQQRNQLVVLAHSQQDSITTFARQRLPLINAFRMNLEGKIPTDSIGLNRNAVMRASSQLYRLDGELAYDRAKVMARIIRSFSDEQREALSKLKFGDSGTWPTVTEPDERRSWPHEIDVAVMTYASELFSWYAGNSEADIYFCPERHGMYFGGFGMKTAPAMGKQNYSISTSLTGDSGTAMLELLDSPQRKHITDLIDLQRSDLQEIISIRQHIATELRLLLNGAQGNRSAIMHLSERYGAIDGELSYWYATAFASVGQSLTIVQRQKLLALRQVDPGEQPGPFLYSEPIRDALFGDPKTFFYEPKDAT
ncbi:hypothetical protein [Sapientia aquatica]|uniref:Uncharacterized protein n=1 Tax=Sapientia aquatica TaxID=1549640 RepID=A0A4R5W279_9BURK|nr:hypothetical protein [Sapientia aquatica]TDK66374.1 hypothetical protein E2I14_07825 [Sapientia aquatica]